MPTVKPQKPAKPSADFPLTPHAGGRWCKKIRGTMFYFGTWDDPEGAEKEYRKIADSLEGGVDPRKGEPTITVRELCNKYLHRQKLRADAGSIRYRTWRELRDLYNRVSTLLEGTGREKRLAVVASLTPSDFQQLRHELSLIYGPVGLKNAIIKTRAVFRWGFANEHLAAPARFGEEFAPPQLKEIKAVRNSRPKRFADAATLRKILKGAGQPMKAMILLGLNGGLGNRDLAALPLSLVDSKSEWLDYPRPKTGNARRIPLWKETRKALADALKSRPESDRPEFFVTRFGNAWAWETPDGKFNDEIGKQFRKLLAKLELETPGLSFYSLRHVFRTVADNATRDVRAIELIMGHAGNPEDMGTHYVEHIDDARLRAVTNAVHKWLFSKGGQK